MSLQKLPLDKLEQLFYYTYMSLIIRFDQSNEDKETKEVSMHPNEISTKRIGQLPRSFRFSRGLLFGILILAALIAFEIFNYSTTDFALTDLMGNLRFLDIRWATILAIAFCGIDFAGIARLFTPEKGSGEPKEVWYLFGAWLLAATMNAILTWWGVAIAILSHESLGGSVISRATMIKVVPLFVAIMVWLIRVLIIGTFSVAGDRLFSQSGSSQPAHSIAKPGSSPALSPSSALTAQSAPYRTTPKVEPHAAQARHSPSEPTYHPVSMGGQTKTPSLPRK